MLSQYGFGFEEKDGGGWYYTTDYGSTFVSAQKYVAGGDILAQTGFLVDNHSSQIWTAYADNGLYDALGSVVYPDKIMPATIRWRSDSISLRSYNYWVCGLYFCN